MSEPEELPIDPVPGPSDPMLEEAPKQEKPPTIKVYLIARPSETGPNYLHITNGISWTSDTVTALRFTRPEDANASMVLFDVLKVAHVAEVEVPV